MVVLLICLVLVVIAIAVVIRLLVAELARSADHRRSTTEPAYEPRAVQPVRTKAPVSPAVRAADRPAPVRVAAPSATEAATVTSLPDDAPLVEDGDLLIEVAPRPRRGELGRVTKVRWWRRLRSGTALAVLVALLGVATAGVIGAIVLVLAFVLEQAIS